MRTALRSIFACLALICASQAARADAPSPLAAMRADRWPEAEAAVAGVADPVPAKLVRFYRMIAPGAAGTAEIASFIETNPDWPGQALLERRRQEALVTESSHAVIKAQCAAPRPTLAPALLRCAAELNAAGDARQAWISGISDPTTEVAFQQRWGSILTQDDEWARFQQLAWSNPQAADRQLARLDAKHRAMADSAPSLVLAQAKALRAASDYAGGATLWKQQGPAAQQAAPDHLTAFWTERGFLIRSLLKQGQDQTAYDLAKAHGQTAGEQVADAEFLAGFIALRRLKQPAVAMAHFKAVAAASPAAITQGRAHYWMGRTLEAMGQDPKLEYQLATIWATTFYGQLAAVALGDDPVALNARVNALRDPTWSRETAQAFAGHEVVRAASWLVAWGDPARARVFLLRMDEIAPTAAERALTADLALKLGLPDTAVFVARRMGRDGIALPQAGWPTPFKPPPAPDEAAALSIIRQESNFDVGAVSPSGARGLMQLMPFTARAVAKRLGMPVSVPNLTVDAQQNMLLGTSYLQEVLDRFGGALPLAAAAYNAGPHRVDQWLADYGDPRSGAVAMTDWLELIPFAETRNYVQRVLENVVVYRARTGSAAPVLQAQWAH
jgi:soluble lytic murein transglycosylase